MITLYQDPRSGNCFKCVLTASHLGKALRTVDIDVMSGQTRQPAFLARGGVKDGPMDLQLHTERRTI